jgi:eukaryotic-like serine/threonine-protein kinase
MIDATSSRVTDTHGIDPLQLSRVLSGQYRIERELGQGGMGVVFLARDERLDRPVAIKVLPAHFSAQAETRERFLREARTAAQLSHPHIVPVHRADEIGGHAFFVMGFIDGESLADRVRNRGPLPPAEVVRIIREVAWALAYAHARGVVHRDIKAENILLERPAGRAVVTDFGIARDLKASPLTQDGWVLGTVHYMSPEQLSGDRLDGRSDLYSLGVAGFYALTGRLPFDDPSAPAVLVAHATRPPPPVRSVHPAAPAIVASVIERCLEKDPAARFATGEDLADALGGTLTFEPSSAEGDDIVLSQEQASAVWRRAARLQAEALQRLEERSPPATADTSAPVSTPGRHSLQQVRSAAVEAGISEQFVTLAFAELPRNAAGTLSAPPAGRWQDRRATPLLGTADRSCAASRTFRASPGRVLQAIGHVLSHAPFGLQLRETVGGHPLDGGVLVFDLEGPRHAAGPTRSLSSWWRATRHMLDARQVEVTLRAMVNDPGATEVTMFVDLRPGVRRSVNLSLSYTIALGVLAGVVGAVTVGAGFGAAVAVAVGAAMLVSCRVWYRSALRAAQRELEQALDAIGVALRAADVFGAPPSVPRPPASFSGSEPVGDDGVTVLQRFTSTLENPAGRS